MAIEVDPELTKRIMALQNAERQLAGRTLAAAPFAFAGGMAGNANAGRQVVRDFGLSPGMSPMEIESLKRKLKLDLLSQMSLAQSRDMNARANLVRALHRQGSAYDSFLKAALQKVGMGDNASAVLASFNNASASIDRETIQTLGKMIADGSQVSEAGISRALHYLNEKWLSTGRRASTDLVSDVAGIISEQLAMPDYNEATRTTSAILKGIEFMLASTGQEKHSLDALVAGMPPGHPGAKIIRDAMKRVEALPDNAVLNTQLLDLMMVVREQAQERLVSQAGGQGWDPEKLREAFGIVGNAMKELKLSPDDPAAMMAHQEKIVNKVFGDDSAGPMDWEYWETELKKIDQMGSDQSIAAMRQALFQHPMFQKLKQQFAQQMGGDASRIPDQLFLRQLRRVVSLKAHQDRQYARELFRRANQGGQVGAKEAGEAALSMGPVHARVDIARAKAEASQGPTYVMGPDGMLWYMSADKSEFRHADTQQLAEVNAALDELKAYGATPEMMAELVLPASRYASVKAGMQMRQTVDANLQAAQDQRAQALADQQKPILPPIGQAANEIGYAALHPGQTVQGAMRPLREGLRTTTDFVKGMFEGKKPDEILPEPREKGGTSYTSYEQVTVPRRGGVPLTPGEHGTVDQLLDQYLSQLSEEERRALEPTTSGM